MKKIIGSFAMIFAVVFLLIGCGSTEQKQYEKNPEFQTEEIRSLEITKKDKPFYSISYLPEDGKSSFESWEIPYPYQSEVIVDTEKMLSIFELIASISFSEENLLPETISISKTDPLAVLEWSYSEKEEELKYVKIVVGNPILDQGYPIWVEGDSTNGYFVPTGIMAQILNITPYDTILKTPYILDINSVECIEIIAGEQRLVVEEQELLTEEGKQFYMELLSGFIIQEADPTRLSEKRNPLLQITYKRKKVNDIVVTYYDYSDTEVSIKVNNTEQFLIDKEFVTKVVRYLL